jgi:hypothetical protein
VTAPLFGRFIENDQCGRARALVGTGKSQTIDAEYDQCFRAVGCVGFGSEFYQRSEIPVPIPSEAVRKDQPMHFDCLQHQVRCLSQILTAMGHATDMVDELDEAEKVAAKGKIDYEARSARQARAYEVLEPLITRAMAQSGQVEDRDGRLPRSLARPGALPRAVGGEIGIKRTDWWRLQPGRQHQWPGFFSGALLALPTAD